MGPFDPIIITCATPDSVIYYTTDGSGSETLIHVGTDPMAIAADTYRKKVYWAENEGGIYRADYDGQNVELVFNSSISYIRGMDIDL